RARATTTSRSTTGRPSSGSTTSLSPRSDRAGDGEVVRLFLSRGAARPSRGRFAPLLSLGGFALAPLPLRRAHPGPFGPRRARSAALPVASSPFGLLAPSREGRWGWAGGA